MGSMSTFSMIVLLAFVMCLALAWPFMWIWNYSVVSALTIAKPISFWVAFWLMLFISIFFVKSNTPSN